jgi:RNA 3'-terminal phosphate cyclase (ATP)
LLIFSVDEESIIGVDSIFDKKTEKFNLDIESFTENSLGVDERLADMLVLPASLTNEMTIFRVNNISKHLETNLFVTSKITGCKYGIGKLSDGFEIRVEGVSNTSIK